MWKKEEGFTLIEMLIVLTIITVLIILIIPNIANKSKQVHETGCEALQQTVQAQVSAFQLEKGKEPKNLQALEDEKFITPKQRTCENGSVLVIKANGHVGIE